MVELYLFVANTEPVLVTKKIISGFFQNGRNPFFSSLHVAQAVYSTGSVLGTIEKRIYTITFCTINFCLRFRCSPGQNLFIYCRCDLVKISQAASIICLVFDKLTIVNNNELSICVLLDSFDAHKSALILHC